ncbi:M56 family metallopeptidase [Paenarthrobacter sp. Z7-10]|uniref:M56 family metallopeptidase n=1 Tax=Paenarthrobacter sp. Z7-10 TaxID=2787635 RepID=UPI0022A9AB23|nr:M56 family metallopeptidase [Paenarthrobacter sp. Z7-10]MCZ2404449.1 M56 family metallopeptidase [Paenarthrobacter sp. Z7-10]
MIAPAVLILLAVILAVPAPVLLRRSTWLERSPRIGIAAWQALSASLVLTVLLAGLALAVPEIPWTTNLAEFFRACAMALRERYATPGGAIISATGAIAALAVLARVGYSLTRGLVGAARNRSRQLQALAIIARPHRDYDAVVVDHSSAAAYCLPGRRRQVVLTSAALTALDESQLAAVLAHEQAHLHGHHHLILAAADALQHAFPGVPAFREARIALSSLVEMLADDAAARRSDRLTVATALVRLAEHGLTPVAALGAGGDSAVTRVRRLVRPARPLGTGKTIAAVLATGALLALPLFLAIAPASAAGTMPPCQADTSTSTAMHT